jgi:hypothetical protein
MFANDPAFAEKMHEHGLWDRDNSLREAFKFVGNENAAYQAGAKGVKLLTKHIANTDEVFKGLAVKMGEQEGLAQGMDPEAAFRYGVKKARTSQNNTSPSNTNPLLAGPLGRGTMMFSAAPLRTLMHPLGQFLAGDAKGLAGSAASVAALYGITRLFGYNALTSIVHAAGKKTEQNMEDALPAVSVLKSEIPKLWKLVTGETSWSDPKALPQGGARRLLKAYQEGDYAKNLGAMHETTGSFRGDLREAVGSTRPGKLLFKYWNN